MHQGLEWIHRLSSAHQHSVAVIRMVCLASVNGQTNQGLQAGFSLTLLWPGFHFPPEAASPTVMGEDKQVEITAIVVPGATTNLREGGGQGEKGRGRETLQGPS